MKIDELSNTWIIVKKKCDDEVGVCRDCLEEQNYTDYADLLVHKGRISAFKEILALPGIKKILGRG